MKKLESQFSLLFRHWIKANPQMTGSYEMKDSRSKNYISFSALEEHQVNYSKAINSDKGVLIRHEGVDGSPDYFYFRNAPAWLVLKYPNMFCIVSINSWEFEKSKSKAKSLTSLRARQIATLVVEL